MSISNVFKIDGFVPNPERDRDYEKRTNETVSQVQGCPAFCEKFIQWTEQNPGCWPDLKTMLASPDQTSRKNALILIAKTVGHIFHFRGEISVAEDKTCEFEGFSETFGIPRVLWRWNAFGREGLVSKEIHAQVAYTLLNALWHDNCSQEKLEEVLAQIHNPSYSSPILVGSGWIWHSTYAIFYKDPDDSKNEIRLAYCNRGADCANQSGIVFLKIKDKSKITLEFLQVLANRIEVDFSQYMSLKKIKELGAEEITYISMKKQKSGNCTYANLKAAIYALLLIPTLNADIDSFTLVDGPVQSSSDIYKNFVTYDANETLKELAQDFRCTEMLLAPIDYYERLVAFLCDIVFEHAPKPKKVNPALLQEVVHSLEICPPLKACVDRNKTHLLSRHVIQSVRNGAPLTPLVIKNYSPLPIEDYSGLRRFDFIMLNLSKFPSQLAPCTHLKELFLRNNHIGVIPSLVGRLLHLETLDLAHNRISEIAEEVGSLPNLKQFDLNGNHLKIIPSVIQRLVNLKDLNLSDNQIPEFSEGTNHLSHLKILRLARNRIQSIPSTISNYSHLKQLVLSYNKILSIPPEIGNCLYLKILNLTANMIKDVPPEIGRLTKLQNLHLDQNEIIALPTEIGNCSNLRVVVLSQNKIEILPLGLFQSNLEELSCGDNQIQAIPSQIGTCSSLEVLYLNNNQITTIPPEIMKCSQLTVCDLKSNKIASISEDLLALFVRKLSFSLHGNPVFES